VLAFPEGLLAASQHGGWYYIVGACGRVSSDMCAEGITWQERMQGRKR
jgi:hypothetical protein